MRKKLRLSIPESLSEITLDQYQKWVSVAITESNKDTYFLKQKTIEILCKVPLKFVATITHKNVEVIFNQLSVMLSDIPKDFVHRFKIGETEYGFIPDFENMSSGEYIDLSSNLSWEDMHNAMAVMFRPITMTLKDKYLIEEYDGIKNEHVMKNIPADVAISSVFFLINSMILLETDLKDYLRQELIQNPQWKTILTANGGGSMESMPSLGMILRRSMLSQNLILARS